MKTHNTAPANISISLRSAGWVLGLLFTLKALDFFLSINLTAESELSPVLLESVLFSVLGVAMLLLAIGVIRLARWVKTPLYIVFVANIFFIIYSTLLEPSWVNAGISMIGAVALFFYLKKAKGRSTGGRLLGLQILIILMLLPATVFIILSVIFSDQALQDDSSLRLNTAENLNDRNNLYITLTNLGDDLPAAANTANELVSAYPSGWNQATANQLLPELQPYISAYMTGTEQNYQCPSSVNDFALDAQMCELNLIREYAEVMQFAALTEAERGNTTQAKEYAMAPIEVGRTMIQSDNVTLIEYLVGLASLNIGLETYETLLEENILNKAAMRQQLSGMSVSTASLRTPIQREYLTFRMALDNKLDLPQTWLYHPNRTRNELFNFHSMVIKNYTSSCNDEVNSENGAAYINNLREKAYNPTTPNLIGNMYLSVVTASLSGVRNNVCEANDRIRSLTD